MGLRLSSSDGTSLELRVIRYQFSSTINSAAWDWDANWLVVGGRGRLSDGTSWSFEDPCLSTREGRELSRWMAEVAAGQHPSDLTFTEPELAFRLVPASGPPAISRVATVVEVVLKQAASEPGARDGSTLQIDITEKDLRVAIHDWKRELRAFPVRQIRTDRQGWE